MSEINLNDIVTVKLTPLGADIYYHQYDKTIELMKRNRAERIIEPSMPRIDSDGFTEFQLHHLMNLYGEYMTVGSENVFVDNKIYFIED